MHRRRERNLDRINRGLDETNKPAFSETINQGGYAQRTMTQPPERDQDSRYDIDLGIVFEHDNAAGPRTTRNWVRDAIDRKATTLKNEPQTKKKCVRVVYATGYQCDFPVFRRRWSDSGWKYEISSGDEWIGSDPAAMNRWIEATVAANSPESSGSYQLRRIIRLGKFFSKTHSNRLSRKFPGGLVATALFIEAYVSIDGRDDQAFRETLRILSNRSKYAPVYADGIEVSDDKDADRIERLIRQAKESVRELEKLDVGNPTVADANKIWKTVFRHSFFDQETNDNANRNSAAFVASQAATALSDSEKQSRMDAAVSARRESGGGGRPWSK
ncbi:hypothetical protein T35B1_16101 [Salinisphaera shabanensis T35B1]